MAIVADSPPFEPTPRSAVRRAERARYDRAAVHAILDEGVVCHVGFAEGEQPFVIPMAFARIDDRLYLHGARATRLLRELGGGVPVCVTVTLVDGLVFGRSAFHCSMNYRSAVVFGRAQVVTSVEEQLAALRAIVEHMAEGLWKDVRGPNLQELARTSVLRLEIEDASAKARSGPPIDDEEDYALPVWAGVVPLSLAPRAPESDPRLMPGIRPPRYVTHYQRPIATEDPR
jgi:nitroimidazol reductase NimA-like FMN-containing flavoprotein (pyridoxamine 5'-phosphate oxidase superfamily)